MDINKTTDLLIALVIFIGLFLMTLLYISIKPKQIIKQETHIQNVKDNTIKVPSVNVDYVTSQIDAAMTKKNIIATNGWEYNEWILPKNNKKDSCYKTHIRNFSVWDDKGININQTEKIQDTIPQQLPNIGDIAVVPNENDWLFNPIRGTINLTQ